MNDTILSGLINLFALVGAKGGIDSGRSESLLNDYLRHHFGLRNTRSYIDLYSDLRSIYDMDGAIDKDSIVEQICANLKGKMAQSELKLMLLRLMEFCHIEQEKFDSDNPVYSQIASLFDVDGGLFDDFVNYVLDKESEHVRHQRFSGYEGYIKTLWIAENRTMIFSYVGKDTVLFDDMVLMPDVFQIWHQSGVLKNSKGAPIYFSSVHLPYVHTSTDHIVYTGKDINFRFPGTDIGMHDLSFKLQSGELVAIMGGSGTGKTTLLSLLNGSIVPQQGSLAINGSPITDPKAKSLIGFVPQDDLLIEELTVYQNLYYTAKLCFDGWTEQEIDDRVMETLRDLCLDHARDLVVGSPLNKTISGGQRKRLNIALELIREPAVLFLDEPTSGLSSSDTENVMGLLKDQTNKGKLVVVNIHQPSSDVYKLFDRLWLLDKGGYPVYDGNPIDAITYFKRAANYADSDTSTCPTCGNINPEIVLNIIDEKVLDSTGHPGTERKTTPKQWHEMYLADRKYSSEPKKSKLPDSGQQRPSAFKQFCIFLTRSVKAKLTNKQYLAITLLEAPLLAVICGLLTHYAPLSGYTVMENQNMVIYLFMAVIVATFLGMSGSAEEIIKDRTLLKREKYLNLSYASYIMSKVVYAAAVSLIQTALFILVGNMIMGLHGIFLMWWGILFITALLSSLIGLLLSQCLSSVVAIYISIPILLIPQILLCGLVVPFTDLNHGSTTGNVPVIGDVIPSRWAFEAIAVGTYSENKYEKPYFELDRARYEALFFRDLYINQLDSKLETIAYKQSKGLEIQPELASSIKTNLPRLCRISEFEYEGDYSRESVKEYLKSVEKTLSLRISRLTIERDRKVRNMIEEIGMDKMAELKRDNYNLQLENTLTNAKSEISIEEVDGVFVPVTGAVFLTPVSHNGRAHFYSPVKVLGSIEVPTVAFNTTVLALMCLLLTVLLIINLPDRKKKYQ